MKNIAINGFGRIGGAALKIMMNIPELDVVAVNDIMNVDNAAYLLQYDSIYGQYENNVAVEGPIYASMEKELCTYPKKTRQSSLGRLWI